MYANQVVHNYSTVNQLLLLLVVVVKGTFRYLINYDVQIDDLIIMPVPMQYVNCNGSSFITGD